MHGIEFGIVHNKLNPITRLIISHNDVGCTVIVREKAIISFFISYVADSEFYAYSSFYSGTRNPESKHSSEIPSSSLHTFLHRETKPFLPVANVKLSHLQCNINLFLGFFLLFNSNNFTWDN